MFIDFLHQVCKPIVENGACPRLLEIAVEVLDETILPSLHQVVEVLLMDMIELQVVGGCSQWFQAQSYQLIHTAILVQLYMHVPIPGLCAHGDGLEATQRMVKVRA